MSTESGGFSRPGFTHLADHLVNAVTVTDDQGRLLYANPAVGALLGWDVTRLFGVDAAELVPPGQRAAFRARLERLVADFPSSRSEPPRRMTMVRPDGGEVPVDAGMLVVAPVDGPKLVVTALWDVRDRVDITGYQRVSDELVAFLASASGTVADVVLRLLKMLARTLDFQIATFWRWDETAGLLHCELVWEADRPPGSAPSATATQSPGVTVRPGEGLAGFAVASGTPYWTSNLSEVPDLQREGAVAADGLTSAFLFPIRAPGRLVGVIELFSTVARELDGPLLEAVSAVCTKLGEFVERVEFENVQSELLAELERSRRRQDYLLRANRALASARGFTDVVRRLAAVAVPTLGDVCLIDVVEGTGLTRLAARHADPRMQQDTDQLLDLPPDIDGPHPAARAVRSGQSQWSTAMGEGFMRATTVDEHHHDLTRRLGFRAYISVPLLTDGLALGALTIVATSPDRRFDEEDRILAEDLAEQVAAVIGRAQALELQSGIAHLLQTSLLPECPEHLPGVELATRYAPSDAAAEVGGDFYDVVPLDGGRIALVIGDVEGHDMAAATIMGQLRSALRAYLRVAPDAGRALDLLDRHLAGEPTRRLATACLAIVDPDGATIELASAGHPPPLFVEPGRPVRELPVSPGPPLGLASGPPRPERSQFCAGSILALYTDGLIDTGRPDDPRRPAQLRRAMATGASGGAAGVADSLLTLANGQADDVAVLVARSLPVRPRPPGPTRVEL